MKRQTILTTFLLVMLFFAFSANFSSIAHSLDRNCESGVSPQMGSYLQHTKESPAKIRGNIGLVKVETAPSSPASFSRHVMCKDHDASYNPVDPTTIFSPTDPKAECLTTVSIDNKIEFWWYYRSDSSKSWDYYWDWGESPGPGSYYYWSHIYVSGAWPGSNYPRGWKVDVYLDDSYYFSEYFEVTDGGLSSHVTCEDVVDGNPVNTKSVFYKDTDTKVHHYIRLDHVAYFNDDNDHCHNGKTIWYDPGGGVYRTHEFYWPDYKDQNPEYDYWSWAYVGNDFVSISTGTPAGTWNVEFYLDTYYDDGSIWYGPVATTQFEIWEEAPPNNPPVLSDGYVDGEGAWWGYTGTAFQFLVKYTDQDGDSAGTRRVYVYDDSWLYFDMDHLAGNPIDGEWFTVFLTGFSCGTHNFFFHFTDEHGADPYHPDSGYFTFTVIELGSDLYCLPIGSKRTDPTDPSTDGTKRLTDISLNGGGQTVAVSPGETVSISCSYQVWSNTNPNEIDQLFFIYSWTLSWPPSSGYYEPIYNGIPGLYPGYSGSDSFTLTAPSVSGTYYLYWCSGAEYSMEDAVARYDQELNTPAHAKIIVGEPDIDVDPMHLDFYTEVSSSQDLFVAKTTNSSSTMIDLVYNPAEPILSKVLDHDLVSIPGSDGFITTPGMPSLPLRTICILVPPEVSVSVDLQKRESMLLKGRFNLFPAQEPRSDMSEWNFTQADPEVYSLDCEWPSNVLEIVGFPQIREYRLLTIRLFPLSYIPKRGKVILNNAIEIRVSFENDVQEIDPWKRSEFFTDMLRNTVLNPNDIDVFYINRETEVYKVSQTPTEYVIITPQGFETAAQPLADWKTTRGVDAEVFTVEYIDSAYTGVDTQEKIRNFLIDCYNSWGIEWVLLAGDIGEVPSRMVYCPDGYPDDGDLVPCDYYYADLTGDWDSNGNGLWGEISDAVDWAAEVFVGRLPAQTSVELQNMVSKIINYEQSPPSGDWVSRMLLAGAYSNYENEDDNGWIKTDEARLKELIRTNLLPDSYTHFRLYEKTGVDPSDYDCELPLTEENVEVELNSGYLLANFAGHGNDYGIYRKVWVSDSNGNGIPESSEISFYNMVTKGTSFSNDMKLFLGYGDACSSAEIDVSESFGEYVVKISDGAIGYVGATRVSWYAIGWNLGNGYNQELDYRFWEYFFDPSVEMKPGAALYLSKLWYANTYGATGSAHRKDLFTYLLLGDPEIKMPSGQPITISNLGDADLEVTSIQCDQPWLSVSPPCPPSFTVPPGESQIVSLCVDPAGLGVGIYYGNVQIYSNDPDENPVTVTVTLDVSDTTPPPAPVISSPTHSTEDEWFSNNDPTFEWTTPSDPSGIESYSYTLDHSPATTPDTTPETTGNSASFFDIADGEWWFHARAKDNEGNWGATDHYRIRVDTTPPSCSITHAAGSASAFVEATDPVPGSGVYAIYVRIDGGPWTEYLGAGPVEIPLVGTESHFIETYSVDNANPSNNESPPKSLTVHYLVVNTDPLGLDSSTGEGWYDAGTEAQVNVDSVLGYTFEYWYLNGQAGTPYSTSMSTTVMMEQPHTATAKFSPISNLYLIVRGHNNGIYYRYYDGSTWTSWNALPGATKLNPAAVMYQDKLYIVVVGEDDSLYWGYLDFSANPPIFSDWMWMSGSTPSCPRLASNSTHLFLVVRGMDNGIYYRVYDGVSWESWNSIPGTTSCSPAASAFQGKLHVVVTGENHGIYWGTVNLTTQVFSGWTCLPGSSSSGPALASNSTHLFLVVRGMDNGIYYRVYDGSVWGSWFSLPGTTSMTPAATIYEATLQIVVAGEDGGLYWWDGTQWIALDGSTPSPPTLAS